MMNKLKPRRSASADTPDNGRRSFFWKLGAGVSGALASASVMARPGARDEDDASLRAALLEEEKSLRKLHQAFEQAMDRGRYDEVVEMFTDDAQVVFNGGVFDNRSRGVSRLFLNRFRSGRTGRRMEPAPGFELEPEQQQDAVDVSADRLSAQAVFPYSIQVGMPIESETSLAGMARLQGEGVRTWWEGGRYRVTYGKDAADGRWKIARLEYETLSRADYRPGRSYAEPITVAPMSTRYPEDRHGPDALL